MRSEPGGLPWVAMGLVVALLTVPTHGYDLLADPLGWLLVGHGATRLRLDRSERRRLLGLVALTAVVAAAIWPAPVHTALGRADPALAWAASLPQIGVAVVLSAALATLARRSGDTSAARWWDVTRTLAVLSGVAPVLVFGAQLDALDAATEVVSVAAPGLLLVLSLRYARRPWAAARAPGSVVSSG